MKTALAPSRNPRAREAAEPIVAGLQATVDYQELPGGAHRTVTLVHPASSDAAAGRISVFSPIGRALVGCRAGDQTQAELPTGQRLRLRVAMVRAEAHDG